MIPLLPNGRIALLPGAEIQRLPRLRLFEWCAQTARYGLVTRELVTWLRKTIGDRRAIEIGAGVGDLGYHLAIPMTDSYIQHKYREVYEVGGHAITTPQPDVDPIDAAAAIAKYAPDVIVASWVTQVWDDQGPWRQDSFSDGVDEDALLRSVQAYIFVGNIGVHGRKRIMKHRHKQYRFPWLQSRTLKPQLNRIWVWER